MYTYSHLIKTWAHMEKRNFKVLLNSEHGTLLSMIPGWELPIDHIHYYFIVLLVGGLVYGMGHGLCAGMHGLSLRYSGILFSYIYPGAFISIAESYLGMLSLWKKLQVACAGIWYNLILCGFCKLFEYDKPIHLV